MGGVRRFFKDVVCGVTGMSRKQMNRRKDECIAVNFVETPGKKKKKKKGNKKKVPLFKPVAPIEKPKVERKECFGDFNELNIVRDCDQCMQRYACMERTRAIIK